MAPPKKLACGEPEVCQKKSSAQLACGEPEVQPKHTKNTTSDAATHSHSQQAWARTSTARFRDHPPKKKTPRDHPKTPRRPSTTTHARPHQPHQPKTQPPPPGALGPPAAAPGKRPTSACTNRRHLHSFSLPKIGGSRILKTRVPASYPVPAAAVGTGTGTRPNTAR